MRLPFILLVLILTACGAQPGQVHFAPSPALPTIGQDGLVHCPPNDGICDNAAFHTNQRLIEQNYQAKTLAIDIEGARRRLITAKVAYQQTPDATHSAAVDEAQARLNTLIDRRGY